MLYLQGPENSNSCCLVHRVGTTVLIEYGGQGRERHQRSLQAPDAQRAQSLKRRTVSRLLSKGYRLGPREVSAIQGCVASPEDGERFLVYGAKLAKGLGQTTFPSIWPSEPARRLTSTELGRGREHAFSPESFGFSQEQTWWMGLVEAATFDGRHFSKWEDASSAYALRRFLRHSQCELMRSLTLLGYRPLWSDILAKEGLPLLNALKVVPHVDHDQQALRPPWKSSSPQLVSFAAEYPSRQGKLPKSLWQKLCDWWSR